MNGKTKKLTAAGMLAGLAYAATAAGRVPLILFLKYDPKDIIVVTAGLVLGPCTACYVSLLVSLAEMFTVSDNGILGFLANVISSCAFSCPSAWIYRKMRKLQGAAVGLFCGWACMVLVMMTWNYLVAPIYMGYPVETVAKLMLPAFLPFNLIKGGINVAAALALYKPVVVPLRRICMTEANPSE